MTTWKLFGREPVYWLGLISASIMVLSSFFIPLTTEQQGVLNAICTSAFGVLTAYFVAQEGLQAAILGFFKAAIALALAFGWHATPEAQGTIMAFVAAVSAMYTRTQVVAPISATGATVMTKSLSDHGNGKS
jgi:hypothetical protein